MKMGKLTENMNLELKLRFTPEEITKTNEYFKGLYFHSESSDKIKNCYREDPEFQGIVYHSLVAAYVGKVLKEVNEHESSSVNTGINESQHFLSNILKNIWHDSEERRDICIKVKSRPYNDYALEKISYMLEHYCSNYLEDGIQIQIQEQIERKEK